MKVLWMGTVKFNHLNLFSERLNDHPCIFLEIRTEHVAVFRHASLGVSARNFWL